MRHVRSASGWRLDVKAMRRPSGLQAGAASCDSPPVSRRAAPVVDVDDPQLGRGRRDEALAVELVLQPVDELVSPRRQRRRVALGLALRPWRAPLTTHSGLPFGLQREVPDVLRQPRQLARLAAVHRQQPDLRRAFLALRGAPGRRRRRP